MALPQAGPATTGLANRLVAMTSSRLLRQNIILFIGGLGAGIFGFVFHAYAGRRLDQAGYGEVASLISAAQIIGNVPAFIISLIVSRYAATMRAENELIGIRHMLQRTTKLVIFACVVAVLASFAFAFPAAAFLNMKSPVPVIWLGIGSALIWLMAVPRGGLQGLQHFQELSINLALEMVVRTAALVLFLYIGMGVTGAVLTVLIGSAAAYTWGMFSLRHELATPGHRVRMRSMAMFSLTAAGGTLGIALLFNGDVVLAEHFLPKADAGLYGALNKTETIVYFLTLSVGQVLFPRVVEAITRGDHPGRLLLMSCGIISLLGLGALGMFGVEPGLVLKVLYPKYLVAAAPLLIPVGLTGLFLSVNNLLVQFFMAAHDRAFLPILGLGCVVEAGLIKFNHGSVTAVVYDVLFALLALLVAQVVRCLILLPTLHPQPARDEDAL